MIFISKFKQLFREGDKNVIRICLLFAGNVHAVIPDAKKIPLW
jgi:hypothetical protein